MSAQEPTLALIDYRVRDLAEQVKGLRHWRGNTDMKIVGLEGRLDNLREEVLDLHKSVDNLGRRIGMFTWAVAGGSITFAFSVLAATGKI